MYSSRAWHAALITVTVAAALSACGSDASSVAADPSAGTTTGTTPTSTPADSTADSTTDAPGATESSAPGWPACETVWTEGADLPKGYAGCTDGAKSVSAEIVNCSSGQRIVIYADHYWAVRGHVIGFAPQGLRDDSEYAHDLYSCRA